MSLRSFAFAAILAAGVAQSALAQAGSTFVDAKCNIFGYGVSTPAPSGGGGGMLAVVIPLTPGTGRTATFGAGGSAWWANSAGSNGPDGGLMVSASNINPVGPISGFAAPRCGELVGLFLEGDPTGLAAPANMAYPDLDSLMADSFSPGDRQVFFIGDGYTGAGTGAQQIFNIPDGATTLVLGIADAYSFAGNAGWYDDNTGGYQVRYDVVPTPGAIALAGLGGMMMARRRR